MRALAILALLGLASCAQQPPAQPVYQYIQITSNPPGASIEINGNYVGKAPLKAQSPRGWYQVGNNAILMDMTIVAYPTQEGHYVQRKHYTHEMQTPTSVYFDMRIPDNTIRVSR